MTLNKKPVPTINIIGGGNVARTLAKSWVDQRLVTVQTVLNRSADSAKDAVRFIGDGTPSSSPAQLKKADLHLIGCGDSDIAHCVDRLERSGILRHEDIVFHCSGLLNSEELSQARQHHALIASAHPLLSFADPKVALENISGSYCALEGDEDALDRIKPLFEEIGFQCFVLDAQHKALYHAAAVIACNYTVTLQDIALKCLAEAGIDHETGSALLGPLLKGTTNNLLQLSPSEALTGPIARGDVPTVERHLQALDAFSADIATVYRIMAAHTIPLSQQQGSASVDKLQLLSQRLQEPTT